MILAKSAPPPPPPPAPPAPHRGTSIGGAPPAKRWPKTSLKDFAVAGIITPAAAHAAWVRRFPARPRAVSRGEGEAFARALGEGLALHSTARDELERFVHGAERWCGGTEAGSLIICPLR